MGPGARAVADGLRRHVNQLRVSGDADSAAMLGHLLDKRESLHVVGSGARAQSSNHVQK